MRSAISKGNQRVVYSQQQGWRMNAEGVDPGVHQRNLLPICPALLIDLLTYRGRSAGAAYVIADGRCTPCMFMPLMYMLCQFGDSGVAWLCQTDCSIMLLLYCCEKLYGDLKRLSCHALLCLQS